MNGLVMALLLPLLQDATELKWNLKEGQEFTCSWSIHFKGGDYDHKLDTKGSLVVSSAGATGAECVFKVTQWTATVDPAKGSTPIRFDNGVLISPEPDSPGAKYYLHELTQPVKLALHRRGDCKAVASQMLESLFKGESTGAIHPDFFGARLPENPVKPGSTWDVELSGNQHVSAESPPIYKVSYKLESVKGNIARITLDSRQESKIKNKKMYDFRIESDTEFNIRDGYCTKWNARVTAKRDLAGDDPGAVWKVRFEMVRAPK